MSGDRYIIREQNDLYFLTLTIVDWVDLFTRKELAMVLVDSMNYCIKHKNFEIYCWCIMSSHIHLICRVKEPYKLSNVLRDFKKYTSKELTKTISIIAESRKEWLLDKFSFEARRTGRAKKYKVWKDDNHAKNLSYSMDIQSKMDYIIRILWNL